MQKLKQLSFVLSSLVFLCICFLSVYFYKDRFYADSAYFFFQAVNSGWFHIEHGRLLLGFSQLIPIITSNLGLPLQMVMLSYSLGVEILYLLLFLFLILKMKDYPMGVALILVHFIGQLWLFHVPSLEICHGAALSLLFYSILKSNKWIDQKWLVLLLLLEWLVLFSHPVNFFLIGFVLLWHILNKGWNNRIHFHLFALLVVGFLVKILTISDYDKAKIDNSERIIRESLFNNTYEILLNNYPDLLLIFSITLTLLIFKKQLLKISFLIGSCLCLILILNRLEPLNGFNFYTEVLLTPIVFIVVFSFSEQLLFKLKSIQLNAAVLFLAFGIITLRLYAIVDYSKPFVENSDKMDAIIDNLQQRESSKYYLDKDSISNLLPLWNWASPIESILFSAIDGSDHTISLVTKNDLDYESNRRYLKDSLYMLRKFDLLPISSLHDIYFELQKETYVSLNSENSVSELKSIALNTKIELSTSMDDLVFNSSDSIEIKIKIHNESAFAIPSGRASKVFISYHWLNEQHQLVIWDGIRTAAEIDLLGDFEQNITVLTPSKSGIYFLKPDIVVEGREWFKLEEEYEIEIK